MRLDAQIDLIYQGGAPDHPALRRMAAVVRQAAIPPEPLHRLVEANRVDQTTSSYATFQDLLGYDGITYYVPFASAVLLVALGSDYNVFVVGRIWEESRVRPLRDVAARWVRSLLDLESASDDDTTGKEPEAPPITVFDQDAADGEPADQAARPSRKRREVHVLREIGVVVDGLELGRDPGLMIDQNVVCGIDESTEVRRITREQRAIRDHLRNRSP